MEASRSKIIPFHEGTESDPYEIRELFLQRHQKRDVLSQAGIPVEKIRCPLLIFSAEEDKIWPSDLYGKQIMERLDEKNSPIQRNHISYSKVGHGIAAPYNGPIYHPVGKFWCKLGGEPNANQQACESSWKAMLAFLKNTLVEDEHA